MQVTLHPGRLRDIPHAKELSRIVFPFPELSVYFSWSWKTTSSSYSSAVAPGIAGQRATDIKRSDPEKGKPRTVLIRGARQVLTLRGSPGVRRGQALGNLGIIENGAILVVNGVISQLGPGRRVENLAEARNAVEVDARGGVVLPGFIDSHTHLPSTPPDHPAVGESRQRVRSELMHEVVKVRALTGRKLSSISIRWIERAVRMGTTTIEAKSGYGLTEDSELQILRALRDLHFRPARIVPTFYGARFTPPEFGDDTEYLDWLTARVLPVLRRKQLARFIDINCGPSGFDLPGASRYLSTIRRMGFQVKLHAEQDRYTGAARLGLINGAVSIDGLDFCPETDIAYFANSQSIATFLPIISERAETLQNVRPWVESGAAVAIATDLDPARSPACSMFAAIAIAVRRMRMKLEEAIGAATINAAHALQENMHLGSLECGKEADLIVLDINDYRELAFMGGANPVAMTMLKGRVIYKEAEVLCPFN